MGDLTTDSQKLSIGFRHLNVQHCYIWLVVCNKLLGLLTVASLGDDLEIAGELQELSNSGTHPYMIICE